LPGCGRGPGGAAGPHGVGPRLPGLHRQTCRPQAGGGCEGEARGQAAAARTSSSSTLIRQTGRRRPVGQSWRQQVPPLRRSLKAIGQLSVVTPVGRLPSSLCRFPWTQRARFPQGIVRTDREEYRQILRASGTREAQSPPVSPAAAGFPRPRRLPAVRRRGLGDRSTSPGRPTPLCPG